MEIYTCRSKDNVYNIARRCHTDPAELIRLNRLNNACTLPEGLSLLIPGGGRSAENPARFFLCSSRRLPDSLHRELSAYLSAMVFCNGRLLPEGSLAPASFTQSACFRSQGLLPVLSVNNRDENSAYDSNALHRLVQDYDSRMCFSQQVSEALENGSFGGLCLQFAYIRPFDGDNLSLLLEELSGALHRQGKYLLFSAPPRLGGQDSSPASAGLDFDALGRFCDFILLQCYDWGHGDSAPQSVAPLHRVRQSIGYALDHVPGSKLLLGISDHGYRWKLPWRQGQKADSISHHIAQSLAISNCAAIGFDRLSQTPFFSFAASDRQRCMVCFEDVRSLLLKLELINEYSLAGAALFSDHPDSRLLYMMQELFDLEKLM